MSATPVAVRGAAFAAALTATLSLALTAGAARERDQLPASAQRFLQATIQASELSTCLQGARDDLYAGGASRIHDVVAVQGALSRLRLCGTADLSRALDQVGLPPAAAITDGARRRARQDIVNGVAVLRRVVLDARGAAIALRHQAQQDTDGTAAVLAYRSADAGSTAAYALAEEALALLGHPQSTVG